MFADGIAFMCFYDAERGLSAIAKFLVYLLEDGKDGVKWERGERKKVGKVREGTEVREIEMNEK